MHRRPEQIGKYEIEGEIGRGSMGTVYRARHEFTRRTVALKVLSPDVTDSDMGEERFRREVSVAGRIDHEGLVQVYDAGIEEGVFYYAMEPLEGVELDELMLDRPLAWGVERVLEAARTVGECHAEGIVHRDIKPENLFVVEETGRTKVLDFGLASVRDATGTTRTGTSLGTPAYVSPEQARDATEAGPASDVWSFGVLLFELATGRLPFESTSAASLLIEIINEEPPSLSDADDVSPMLASVVDRCLVKNPDRRIPDASQLARELEGVVGELEGRERAEATLLPSEGVDGSGDRVDDSVSETEGDRGGSMLESSEVVRALRQRRVWMASLAGVAVLVVSFGTTYFFMTGGASAPDGTVEKAGAPGEFGPAQAGAERRLDRACDSAAAAAAGGRLAGRRVGRASRIVESVVERREGSGSSKPSARRSDEPEADEGGATPGGARGSGGRDSTGVTGPTGDESVGSAAVWGGGRPGPDAGPADAGAAVAAEDATVRSDASTSPTVGDDKAGDADSVSDSVGSSSDRERPTGGGVGGGRRANVDATKSTSPDGRSRAGPRVQSTDDGASDAAGAQSRDEAAPEPTDDRETGAEEGEDEEKDHRPDFFNF